MLAGLDLWDVVHDDYMLEMASSRFVKEGAIEPFVAYVRGVTGKPVVSVGRFTSPDAMVSQIKRGAGVRKMPFSKRTHGSHSLFQLKSLLTIAALGFCLA